MSAPRRFEHARLRVPELAAAASFYAEVMGLVELGRANGTVYLGAGLDTNFDLALVEGSTGVEHFALRADGDEQLEALERAVNLAGVSTERHGGEGPGELEVLTFLLPSGHRMEFVTVEDQRYLEPYRPAVEGRGAMGLLDADHINLTCPDARGLSEFLRDALGFRVSDVIELEDGSWLGGWTRMGELHHDLAVLLDPEPAHTLAPLRVDVREHRPPRPLLRPSRRGGHPARDRNRPPSGRRECLRVLPRPLRQPDGAQRRDGPRQRRGGGARVVVAA